MADVKQRWVDTGHADDGTSVHGRVVKVADGDSYVIKCQNGDPVTVHLWGADTPARSQPYGPDAAEKARIVAHGSDATVDVKFRFPEGPLVGRVEVGRQDMGQLLVNEGLAWHDADCAPEAIALARLQREARASGRGLWSESAPIPPWVWRWREDKKGSGVVLPLLLLLLAGAMGGIAGVVSQSAIWGVLAACVGGTLNFLGYLFWLKRVSSNNREKPPADRVITGKTSAE